MNHSSSRKFFLFAGASGIIGTCCYVLAILVDMNQSAGYAVAMAWPVLSIIFVFGLVHFIASTNDSYANQLAGIFAYIAFGTVAAMLSVQLAVKIGTDTYIASSASSQKELLETVKRSLRLVDMGLDVAWDMFIGTSLICLAVALKGHRNFGLGWSIPAALLAILLIVLNTLTFPWPPDSRDLFDIGPAIGLYIIAISGRMFFLASRMNRGA